MTEVFTVTISTVIITDNVTSQAQGPPHYVDELKLANKVILSTILAFIMVAMGCVISIKDLKMTVSLYLDSFTDDKYSVLYFQHIFETRLRKKQKTKKQKTNCTFSSKVSKSRP